MQFLLFKFWILLTYIIGELFLFRASVRVEDAYVHVPGYHPTLDNPTFYQQRTDNPRVLPSLHKHLWGRVASLGSLILKAEKEIIVTSRRTDSSSSPISRDQSTVKFTNDPLKVVGDGSCLMVEWSQPTVVAIARVIHHLKCEYKLFTTSPSSSAAGIGSKEGEEGTSLSWKDLPPVDLKFQLSDLNAFLYGLTPGTCIHKCISLYTSRVLTASSSSITF